jgi:threonine/homoserine/homoserine lactone efflux protein
MRQPKRENQVYLSNVGIGILVAMILFVLLVAEIATAVKYVLAAIVFAGGVYLTRR